MRSGYNLDTPGFTVGNIHIFRIVQGKNYTYSYRNGRLFPGFIYVEKGSLHYQFRESCTVQAGQLLFIPQKTVYTATYLEDQTQIKIVQFDLSSGSLPEYLSSPHVIDLPDGSELIESFFRQPMPHPLYSLSRLYELLWKIDRKKVISSKYNRLQPILEEMTANYTRNEKISHYAALCGMSEPNFRRLFREFTGQSPVDYRNTLRLNAARVKLQSGEYNVSEAAENSGFSNLSFFIRLYKKKYGHTPKQE